MDNANEIDADFTHKEVALFLGDDLKNQAQETVITYDLDEEYAKTAKHRQLFVWILLGICFFIVGLGTFTTIGFVSKSNHKITINIDSFDDLNLRSLLNSVGRAQSLYENAIRNKANLEQNLNDELNLAQQKRETDLFTLLSISSVSSKEDLLRKKLNIESEYASSVQKIQNLYSPQILEAENAIKKYQNQVEAYDSEKVSKAKTAESSIDSTKQLHDIEMRSQQERYERKIKELREQLIKQQIQAAESQKNAVEEVRSIYQAKIDLLDPKAREQSKEQNRIILEAGIQNPTPVSALWKSVENLKFTKSDYYAKSGSSAENLKNSLKDTQNELNELSTIAYRFKPIPMENSIKDYVPAMLYHSYQIANNLAETSTKIQENLTEFENLAEKTLLGKADGVILNTENSPNFKVYVLNSSRARISEIPVSVQILNNEKIIAEGTISKKGEEFILTQNTESAQNQIRAEIGDTIKFLQ